MNSLKTELDAETAHQVELAESELKAALIFAEFSSTSYSTGNLQRATDARSKAKAVCASAARRLAAPEVVQVSPDSVKLIWTEVQNALAELKTPQVGAKVHTAGR